MKLTKITSCYIGPQISPEQFISEHFFLYLGKGAIIGYDGQKSYTLNAGESCLARKNHLGRYTKQKDDGEFEKVVIVFDEQFLKDFLMRYPARLQGHHWDNAFILLNKSQLVSHFIESLQPYYNQQGKLDETFSKVKREELLLILLETNPGLGDILFDFAAPGKIDLKSFMNRNFRFNVSIERFAYLTGRSLSAFKKEFKQIFSDTPSHWLIQKRLQEAHFQIEKNGKKPSEIYIDLGFEDLSHFSFVFKKKFGFNPSELRTGTI